MVDGCTIRWRFVYKKALDHTGTKMLTGAYQKKEALRVWDFADSKKPATTLSHTLEESWVYCCTCFSSFRLFLFLLLLPKYSRRTNMYIYTYTEHCRHPTWMLVVFFFEKKKRRNATDTRISDAWRNVTGKFATGSSEMVGQVGTLANEARLIATDTKATIGRFLDDRALFAMDFNASNTMMAVGGASRRLIVLNVDREGSAEPSTLVSDEEQHHGGSTVSKWKQAPPPAEFSFDDPKSDDDESSDEDWFFSFLKKKKERFTGPP